jgi:hypothetical protein
MIGALILIFIVIIAGGLIGGYVMMRGSQVVSGASVAITSAQASVLANGQTYLTVSVTNTGTAGYISIGVYSGGTQVFFAPGAPGLEYQIYYTPNQWFAPPANLVYSAELSPGTSFSAYGQTWTASTNPFFTAYEGTTQNVNGQLQPNVVNNLQVSYSGGEPFPNPPVSNGWNSYAIKEIGYMVVTEPTTFYVDIDDGGILSYAGYSGSYPSITSWLGSNPTNLINEWIGEGATMYESQTVQPGTYMVQYDYFNGGGPAYFSLFSNNPVLYYHPLLLNSGQTVNISYVMPVTLNNQHPYTVSATIVTPEGSAQTTAPVVIS